MKPNPGCMASTAQPGLGIAFLVRRLVKIRFTVSVSSALYVVIYSIQPFFPYRIHNKTFVYRAGF
jgi:hypothetical protein